MTSRTASRRRAIDERPSPERRPLPVVALALGAVVVVLVLGLVIAFAGEGGDDTTGGATGNPFGQVAVSGAALAPYPGNDADDPSPGAAAPVLEGETPEGSPITVGDDGQPTVVAFLAHWCPHCQAEVPLLVDLSEQGAFDGVRLVAVLTGTKPGGPNYPPVDWLEREAWAGEIMVDDEASSAASAYGLAGYPFLVAVDSAGNVVARSSGELPAESVVALADAARGDG